MGMDATCTIWVGFGGYARDISSDIPEEVIDAADMDSDGFERIYCSDEQCGLGVVVHYHDWDFGVRQFDPAELSKRISAAEDVWRRYMPLEPRPEQFGVWIQTDFS